MKKYLLLMLALVFSVGLTLEAQETTGGIIGSVKDATGAFVGGATVTLTGPALIGEKVIRTDSKGSYQFLNIPPGGYTIVVFASGFSELKRENVRIEVGRQPTIDLTVTIGSQSTVVEVNAGTPQIDVTQSRVQTTIDKSELDLAPHGRSYQSVIAVAPGARSEQLNGGGGYSIDGATSNENGYLIDGINTISPTTGLSSANVPIEFIQEVTIKTSGYDAENGGALGGVVNAVLAHGGNQWHGQALLYYEGDSMNAGPNSSIRSNPGQALTGRIDSPYQYYAPVKDHYRYVQPGFLAGGYLLRDRLWLSAGLEPLFTSLRRTVNFNFNSGGTAPIVIAGPRIFTQDTQQYFGYTRLDYRLSNRIRLFASDLYQYYRIQGSSLPNQDDRNGLLNTTSTQNPDNYNHGIGNVQPNSLYTFGADIQVTNSLVSTTRLGYFVLNYGDRGLPVGDRHLFSLTGVNVPPLNNAQGQTNTAGDALNHAVNFADLGANTQTLQDARKSKQFSEDISFYKKGFFGAHNLKAGYLATNISENVNTLYNKTLTRIYPGTVYSPVTALGQTNCSAIGTANLAKYGTVDNSKFVNSGTKDANGNIIYTRAPNTTVSGVSCMGDYGYLTLYDYSTTGQASTTNNAVYVQDGWTVGKGVTLNLGLRFESETLPSFNQYSTGINFGLGDKVAPRIGGAWDVFQNGKMKVFGSYGVFYDVVKLHLAVDSFGAAYGSICAYALDDENWSGVIPARDSTGHFCPSTPGSPGNFSANSVNTGIRFIENNNTRVAANDPTYVAKYGQLVDPNLKPYRQHETVMGVDYQIARNLAFESRYVRRRLDHAIEDVGIVDPVAGEVFHIENPGEGQDYQPIANCPNCKAQPRAARLYDAVEFRITKTPSAHWFFQGSYLYSHLRGNYSGLTDTDVADGNTTVGRTDSNDNRSFDEAYMQFDAYGRPFNGLLATDRPNSFKGFGYYRMSYLKRHTSSIGLFQTASSGTPLSSYIEAGASTTPIYPEGRGKWVDTTVDSAGNITVGAPYVRRTPWYIQTDMSFTHSYAVSRTHEAWRLGFEANFTNVFNLRRATVFNSEIESASSTKYVSIAGASTPGTPAYYGALENGYDYKSLLNSQAFPAGSQYGHPSVFQAPRTIRLKAKFTFKTG